MHHILVIEIPTDNTKEARVVCAERQHALSFIFMASVPGTPRLRRRLKLEPMTPSSLADQLQHWRQCNTADDALVTLDLVNALMGRARDEMVVVFLNPPSQGQPGYITCMASVFPSHDDQFCVVHSFIVDPAVRGKGAGRFHLRTLERMLPIGFPDAKFIWLVSSSTTAGFWTKCGFVEENPPAFVEKLEESLKFDIGCHILTKAIK